MIQEAGHRDYVNMVQHCHRMPTPTDQTPHMKMEDLNALVRLRWERTLVPGKNEMTCQVVDPSNNERYILQAYPCQNPVDANNAVQQVNMMQTIRNPYICKTAKVFCFKYQVRRGDHTVSFVGARRSNLSCRVPAFQCQRCYHREFPPDRHFDRVLCGRRVPQISG